MMPASRWLVRVFVAAAGIVALHLAGADLGVAAELDGRPSEYRWDGPGHDLEDSRGIEIWRYGMYLDEGQIDTIVPGKLVAFGWGIYRAIVSTGIWLIDWVLSFSWLSFLATPVTAIGAGLQQIVSQLGLTLVLLTITAFVCAVWMLRGRWSLGLYELGAALVVASIATGLLSNPVSLVTGPDGFIMASRDIGFQIADGLTNDGGQSDVLRQASVQVEGVGPVLPRVERLRNEQTARLVDSLIRGPAQAINFGTNFDGSPCEDAYNELLHTDPSDYRSRDPGFWDAYVDSGMSLPGALSQEPATGAALAECSPEAVAVADNPNMEQVVAVFVVSIGAAGVLAFAVFLAGAVLLAGITVLFQSVKAIVALVAALLPGRGRAVLWQTVADVLMSLIVMIFSIVFLSAYMLVVDTVLAMQDDLGSITTFFVVDIVLVAGLLVFWRGRRSLLGAGQSLARALSARPSASPTAMPAPSNWGQNARRTAHRLVNSGVALAAWRARTRPRASSEDGYQSGAAGAGPIGLEQRRRQADEWRREDQQRREDERSTGAFRRPGAGRVASASARGRATHRSWSRKAATFAANAVVATGTGGGATAARSASAARTARRAAMVNRLRAARRRPRGT